MRVMRGGRARKFKSEINVVPYIDVMLVLLVIFMVVAPMTTPGVVDLPRAEKTAQPPTEYIEIAMTQGKDYQISIKQQKQSKDKPVTGLDRAALMQKLRELHANNPKAPVMISADKDSNYGDVIQLISDAQKLGIDRVALATK